MLRALDANCRHAETCSFLITLSRFRLQENSLLLFLCRYNFGWCFALFHHEKSPWKRKSKPHDFNRISLPNAIMSPLLPFIGSLFDLYDFVIGAHLTENGSWIVTIVQGCHLEAPQEKCIGTCWRILEAIRTTFHKQEYTNHLQKSPQWCVVVKMKNSPKSRHPVPGTSVERLSISISSEDKSALEQIADEKKVSLAWVIRDAVSQYLQVVEDSSTVN